MTVDEARNAVICEAVEKTMNMIYEAIPKAAFAISVNLNNIGSCALSAESSDYDNIMAVVNMLCAYMQTLDQEQKDSFANLVRAVLDNDGEPPGLEIVEG